MIDVEQIVFALRRAERRLQDQANALHDRGDYSAELPAEDAQRMREAIALLDVGTRMADDLVALVRRQGLQGSPLRVGDPINKAGTHWLVFMTPEFSGARAAGRGHQGRRQASAATISSAGAGRQRNAMNQDLSDGARKFLQAVAQAGGLVTDGPITGGWGVLPFMGERAHHWTVVHAIQEQDAALLRSACGMEDYAVRSLPLLGAGSFPLCKRCENALMKRHARPNAGAEPHAPR